MHSTNGKMEAFSSVFVAIYARPSHPILFVQNTQCLPRPLRLYLESLQIVFAQVLEHGEAAVMSVHIQTNGN